MFLPRYRSQRTGPARGFAALLAVLLLLVQAFPASAAEAEARRVLDLTNAERTKAGLAPFALNPNLASAAQTYSDILASTGCFSHACGPVPDMAKRSEAAGYAGWRALGENIAAGQRTPDQVVAGWMNSPGHRANILNPAYTEIGIGHSLGGSFGVYWSQSFGSRGNTTPGSLAFQPLPTPTPGPEPAVVPAPEPAAEPAPEEPPVEEEVPQAAEEVAAPAEAE